MSHLYFDLRQRGDLTLDEEGCESACLETARRTAIEGARGIMVADLLDGVLCLDGAIVIRDDLGSTVMVVPFDTAISVRPRSAGAVA